MQYNKLTQKQQGILKNLVKSHYPTLNEKHLEPLKYFINSDVYIPYSILEEERRIVVQFTLFGNWTVNTLNKAFEAFVTHLDTNITNTSRERVLELSIPKNKINLIQKVQTTGMQIRKNYKSKEIVKLNNTRINSIITETLKKWKVHRKKWNQADGYMHLIYGNLAITRCLVMLYYINTEPFVLDKSSEKSNFHINVKNIRRIGANYFASPFSATHKTKPSWCPVVPTTLDIMRKEIYNLSWNDLQNYATDIFDNYIYEIIGNKLPKSFNHEFKRKYNNQSFKARDVVDIMNFINTNFVGRSGQGDIMTFYGHNLGMFQFLAMYGYINQKVIPFTGNCTVIAIIRLTIYEKITQGKLRRLKLLVQSKMMEQTNGSTCEEVCHYGLVADGMNKASRQIGGNIPSIQTVNEISNYQDIYDILTTNAVMRAQHRFNRNKSSILQRKLYMFNKKLEEVMSHEAKTIHGHKNPANRMQF